MSDLIVISDIPFGSAYAYRRGDVITKEAVEANGWQDYVTGRSTKAAREALGEPEETPAASGGKEK
jgi:hypothetical protein